MMKGQGQEANRGYPATVPGPAQGYIMREGHTSKISVQYNMERAMAGALHSPPELGLCANHITSLSFSFLIWKKTQ